MKLIGITGGVGSGKSELLKYIREHYRSRILLSDEAAHEVYVPGGLIYRELVDLLEKYPTGNPLLDENGFIIKKEMAARIFVDEDLLTRVNGLIHPAVRVYIENAVEEERRKGEADFFFLESALLIEAGYRKYVDEMWYIYCREDVRRMRLKASRGYSDEKIDSIIRSQISEEEFRSGCDVIIDNSGELDDAYRQIDQHMKELMQ